MKLKIGQKIWYIQSDKLWFLPTVKNRRSGRVISFDDTTVVFRCDWSEQTKFIPITDIIE